MVARSLERDWRVIVRADSDERSEALSTLLWTFSEEAFVPHGTKADGNARLQPVWLTPDDDNPNQASVIFFVDSLPGEQVDGFERVVILFNGSDAVAVDRAREKWKWAKAAGHEISYWQQDESGRWLDRATA